MADVLLVGGGVASATCAGELRARGFDGSVLLVGRELDPPYERPPCSKAYLRGSVGREAIALELPGDVEVRTRTSVLKLDPSERAARLSPQTETDGGAGRAAAGQEGDRGGAGARGDGRQGTTPAGRGRAARRHPLPPRAGQRR